MHTLLLTTPLGEICLGATNSGLCLCDWTSSKWHMKNLRLSRTYFQGCFGSESFKWIDAAAFQLEEYFNGKRREFDVPLAIMGTPFQQEVWNRIMDIPYGKTKHYRDISKELNNPFANRAVGNATGSNRLSLFIPCHRVVKDEDWPGNYAGGRDAKERLLNFETAHILNFYS